MKNKTYILAEMAASHEGKLEIAQSIIESAAKAKADGVLFQIIDLESYIVPNDEDYDDIRSFSVGFDVWLKLIEKANFLGLDVWANVYDLKSAQFCKNNAIKGFKLHSSNLENEDLIKEVVSQNKDILLSVGGMNKDEIKKTLDAINLVEDGPLRAMKTILMYGLQNFPTDPKGINLNFISELSKELNLDWGYQDHSDPKSAASTYLPILAISYNAGIIEKHIIDKREPGRQDYESALNPDEFEEFVNDIKAADEIISKEVGEVSDSELKYRKYKAIMKATAVKDIKEGDEFSKANTAAMRSKSGQVPAKDLKSLLGKKSRFNYNRFDSIKKDEL